MNSLENQYIDKLPKLPNAQNDSHVVLPKIYLTNLKIAQQTERKTGSMPDSKKINENSFSNKANDSHIYKKKAVHNKTKLQSLSKEELTKVFNKYRAKISCENTPANELQSNPTPSRPVPELQTKPPPKIQEKSNIKEQSSEAKGQVEEKNLPNEKSPKAKPKETGGFAKKTSIDKSSELPQKKDEPKKSVAGAEGVIKQGSQKNVENSENQKEKETEIKKEEIKEPEKGKEGKSEESPIKENGNLELSPVKKEGEEGKEYEEEIFEDPVEKN